MLLAEDAKTDAGGIVLKADCILLRDNIEKIKEQGISGLYIIHKEVRKEYKPLRGKTAVVVDDSLYIRHMLAKVLYYMGVFVCGDAETGELGLGLANKFKPDLLIMDIHLPGMNGIETIKKIKAKLPGTKFLAISSDKNKQTIVDSIRAGAGDFMVKPLKWDQLESRIANLLLN